MTVIVLSGPTCAGKTTVESELHATKYYAKMASHTTRAAREGEINGQHYHFATEAEFDRLALAGQMIESYDYGGRRYGKSVTALTGALGRAPHVATVLEPHGARNLRRHCRQLGIPFLNVWIDCDPQVQAARFIARIQDQDRAQAAERLALMLSLEQDWRDQALTRGQYELKLSSSTRSARQLAGDIHEFVRGTMAPA